MKVVVKKFIVNDGDHTIVVKLRSKEDQASDSGCTDGILENVEIDMTMLPNNGDLAYWEIIHRMLGEAITTAKAEALR